MAPAPRSKDDGELLRSRDPISSSLCLLLTAEDEQVFEEVWRRLGLSVDWSLLYSTISERARRTSQMGFLRMLASGDAYSPRPRPSGTSTSTPRSPKPSSKTARPPGPTTGSASPQRRTRRAVDRDRDDKARAAPACVALVCHPDDAALQPLVGTDVVTPLFGVPVPVVAHPLADPEKGSGIAMICTFGDTTDVVWWRELGLPTRTVIGRDGTVPAVHFGEPGWESDRSRQPRERLRRDRGQDVAAGADDGSSRCSRPQAT